MFAQEQQDFEAWMKPSQDMFNYWISFFPTAPLFGVEWRFGEMMGQGVDFAPMAQSVAPKPAAKPAKAEATPVAYDRVAQPKTPSVDPVEVPAEAPVAVAPAVIEEAPVVEQADVVTDTPAEANDAPQKPKGLLAKAPADADDLKLIKGVGPGLEKQLNALGIYRFRQLAKFKEADLTWVDENLSSFKGRCFRDDWVGQSKALKA